MSSYGQVFYRNIYLCHTIHKYPNTKRLPVTFDIVGLVTKQFKGYFVEVMHITTCQNKFQKRASVLRIHCTDDRFQSSGSVLLISF